MKYTVTLMIRSDIKKVFEFLTETEKVALWNQNLLSQKITRAISSPEKKIIQTEFEVFKAKSEKNFRQIVKNLSTTTEFVPEKKIVTKVKNRFGQGFEIIELFKIGDYSRVTITMEIILKPAFLNFFSPFLKTQFQKETSRTYTKLKLLLES